jgi:hypothetical protein
VRVHEVQVAVRGKVINDQVVGVTTIVRHRQQENPFPIVVHPLGKNQVPFRHKSNGCPNRLVGLCNNQI